MRTVPSFEEVVVAPTEGGGPEIEVSLEFHLVHVPAAAGDNVTTAYQVQAEVEAAQALERRRCGDAHDAHSNGRDDPGWE